jgi:hypothetical protein
MDAALNCIKPKYLIKGVARVLRQLVDGFQGLSSPQQLQGRAENVQQQSTDDQFRDQVRQMLANNASLSQLAEECVISFNTIKANAESSLIQEISERVIEQMANDPGTEAFMEILCLETLIGTYFGNTEEQKAKGRLFPNLLGMSSEGEQHVSSDVLVTVACLLRGARMLHGGMNYNRGLVRQTSSGSLVPVGFELEVQMCGRALDEYLVLFDLVQLTDSLDLFAIFVAHARYNVVSTACRPSVYGSERRIVTSIYDADCIEENPEITLAAFGWSIAKLAIAELSTSVMSSETRTSNGVTHTTPGTTRNDKYASLLNNIHALSGVGCEKVNHIRQNMLGSDQNIFQMPCTASKFEKFRPKLFAQFEYSRGPCHNVWPDIAAKKDGWFGPIRSISDLDEAILAISLGTRPALDTAPSGRGNVENCRAFCISYKHTEYDNEWRMGAVATRRFKSMVESLLSLENAESCGMFLWLDRVFAHDVKFSGATWSASTLELYATHPVLFVESEVYHDTNSLWVWCERIAALSGQGCFGNARALLLSSDTTGRLEIGKVATNSRTSNAEEAAHTDDIVCLRHVERRPETARADLAQSILTSNLNQKGAWSDRDLHEIVMWAQSYSICHAPVAVSLLTWMGVMGKEQCLSRDAVERPNLLRIGEVSKPYDGHTTCRVGFGSNHGFGIVKISDCEPLLGDVMATSGGLLHVNNFVRAEIFDEVMGRRPRSKLDDNQYMVTDIRDWGGKQLNRLSSEQKRQSLESVYERKFEDLAK